MELAIYAQRLQYFKSQTGKPLLASDVERVVIIVLSLLLTVKALPPPEVGLREAPG